MFIRFSLPALDDFTDKDNKNIEIIYKNVLMTTKSREQKALVKKYLEWVSRQPKKKREQFFCCFFFYSFLFFFLGFNVVSGSFENNLSVWNMESKL